MEQAVSSVKSVPVEPAGIDVENPATGARIGRVPIRSAEEVRALVGRARVAQKGWAALPLEERCRRILWLRDALLERREDLVNLISQETGKPRMEALAHEVVVVADMAVTYAKRAPEWLAPRTIDTGLLLHRQAYAFFAPKGVVGVVSPWNFPFGLSMAPAIAALVAGNAVVLKPSEVTPLNSLLAKEVFDASGLPPDLFLVATGDGRTGAALIDAGIDHLVFTGAVSTGRKVAAACGERLIPCTLELGGKAAAIVCADADVERTARAIVWGGFANVGQVCVSVERVYAVDAVHDRLVERIGDLTAKLRVGDPADDEKEVGAITFPRQVEVAEKLLADAKEKGARIVQGGKRLPGPGRFFEPTIVVGATHEMDVMREEIFGPIVPVMRVSNEQEAIDLANDSHLGLAGYVFTRDRDRGRRIAERIRAGSVQINDTLSFFGVPDAPFGGVKSSGMGRVHGPEGLRELCEIRQVHYDRIAPLGREPWWFPYSKKAYRAAIRGLPAIFGGGGIVKRIRSLL